MQTSARLYHYRDRDQTEVDGVLENDTGEIIGIEVKASETVRSDDFRGLRLLQRRLGDRFRAGSVLYCGQESLSFGDGLTCLPISAPWTTEAGWSPADPRIRGWPPTGEGRAARRRGAVCGGRRARAVPPGRW
ncbi:DUF4143 domain-containing protein [Streptosporangium sp. NPDC004631]